ncbi:MAG: hypothetical protein M3011_01550 [Actinomycetota bacterium]|nr:hypothetical protein [Actinomycetota bacterium]
MTSAAPDDDFWGPPDSGPEPVADPWATKAERPEPLPEPQPDLPKAGPFEGGDNAASTVDHHDPTVAHPGPGVGDPAWAVPSGQRPDPGDDTFAGADQPAVTVIEGPPYRADALPDHSNPMVLDLPEQSSATATDPAASMVIDLPANGSNAATDLAGPMVIDLPEHDSDAMADHASPMVVDLAERDAGAPADSLQMVDPMVLDLPDGWHDRPEAVHQHGAHVGAGPVRAVPEGPPSPDPRLPATPAPSEAKADDRPSPIGTPVAAVADVFGAPSGPSRVEQRAVPARPPRSTQIGPIVPAAPWWVRAREGRVPGFVASGVAAVAAIVVGVFVIRGGGPETNSSRLVSAPPAAPVTKPMMTSPGATASPPNTPATPAPAAAILGPPAPAKPAGAAPVVRPPSNSSPSTPSSAGQVAGSDPTASEPDPAVDGGSSAPAGGQPSNNRPPVVLFPPTAPPPPPVVTPPSPPVPPTTPPSDPGGGVCRNVPAAAMAECLAAIG